jgi:hypothetical protein
LYQNQHDKIKRKALLAPNPAVHNNFHSFGDPSNAISGDQSTKMRTFGTNMVNAVNLGAVVEGMEANGVG